jgi:hypothetical protein
LWIVPKIPKAKARKALIKKLIQAGLPSGAKARYFCRIYGTTKVVPGHKAAFRNARHEFFRSL